MKIRNVIHILLAGFFLFGAGACSEGEIESYDADSYIYFDKESKDSTLFSFAYDADLKEADVELKMRVISRISDRDRKFDVRFVESESTAKEGRDFTWAKDNMILPAQSDSALMKIHVMKDASLKGKTVKAVFEIVSSDDFLPGIVQNRKAQLVITDKLNKPEWWDGWHETSGLGLYSDKKYQLFIKVSGRHDFTLKENGGEMDFSDMYGYVVMFKYWLLKNPQKEEDGSDMSVAIIG